MSNRMVIGIYGHPEGYPPTLNALRELNKTFSSIKLVFRPVHKTEWKYPENVELIRSGKEMTVDQQEKAKTLKKVSYFFRFTLLLLRETNRQKPQWILLYDNLPTLSFLLVRPLMKSKPKVWYHNHDVIEPNKVRKWSLTWFSKRYEKTFFKHVTLFTLPAIERKEYFDLSSFKGEFAFLPNYPSLRYLDLLKPQEKCNDQLRLIFQGSIGTGHGIEEIMKLLPLQINGRKVKLVLKGFLKPDFRNVLTQLIADLGIQDEVEIIGVTPYQEIVNITSSCHIGIAIFSKDDWMNRTLGTASNKIYEYAACGLPVIYYSNEHFKYHLGNYNWARGTDLSTTSITGSLNDIEERLETLGASAQNEYQNQLNYEKYFEDVKTILT